MITEMLKGLKFDGEPVITVDLTPMIHAPAETKDERTVPLKLIEQLKQADQDHEFYPTTNEIIRAVAKDIGDVKENRTWNDRRGRHYVSEGLLDIGAGTGKVLMALSESCGFSELFAIEKSPILCRQMPSKILVVGTDFMEQSLLSKHVDVVFCNPPYSAFAEWSTKVIREAAARTIYLVIPQRWQSEVTIQDAIKFRDGTKEVIGEYTFEDSEDRKARAKVHLLKITLRAEQTDDAFERFFNEQFADLIGRFKEPEQKADAEDEKPKAKGGGRKRLFNSLVVGPNYPEAMVQLYNKEMENIHRNYQLIAGLDVDLLREFDISPPNIMKCLKERLKGLKSDYWQELFSHLNTVTDRLCSKTRKKLLETLQRHVEVDFTVPNICEVVCWVIKNANEYIDEQLIEVYDLMVDKCTVQLYKSNKRVWHDNRWKYKEEQIENTHFKLDYRIVTHRVGGISYQYSWDRGLAEPGRDFLRDLLTVANNLGFRNSTQQAGLNRDDKSQWRSGEKWEFQYIKKGGELGTLFEVRAYQNGNMHLKINQAFMLALNVEHGRLKGWIHTPQEAVEELQDKNAAQYFNNNLKLGTGDPFLMLGN